MDECSLLEIIDTVLTYKEPIERLLKKRDEGDTTDKERSPLGSMKNTSKKSDLIRAMQDPISTVSSQDLWLVQSSFHAVEQLSDAVRHNLASGAKYPEALNKYVCSLFESINSRGLAKYKSDHLVDIENVTSYSHLLAELKDHWDLPPYKWPEYPVVTAVMPPALARSAQRRVMKHLDKFFMDILFMLFRKRNKLKICNAVCRLLNEYGWLLESNTLSVYEVYEGLKEHFGKSSAHLLMGDLECLRDAASFTYRSLSVELPILKKYKVSLNQRPPIEYVIESEDDKPVGYSVRVAGWVPSKRAASSLVFMDKHVLSQLRKIMKVKAANEPKIPDRVVIDAICTVAKTITSAMYRPDFFTAVNEEVYRIHGDDHLSNAAAPLNVGRQIYRQMKRCGLTSIYKALLADITKK